MTDPGDGPTTGRPVGALEPIGAGVLLLRGGDLGCARLLILLGRAVRELPAGSVVQLETTDPIAPIDLPAWCRLTGHEYLGRVPTGDEPTDAPRFAVRTAADPRPTDPQAPWRPADRPR